jgi:hypothetical protein
MLPTVGILEKPQGLMDLSLIDIFATVISQLVRESRVSFALTVAVIVCSRELMRCTLEFGDGSRTS